MIYPKHCCWICPTTTQKWAQINTVFCHNGKNGPGGMIWTHDLSHLACLLFYHSISLVWIRARSNPTRSIDVISLGSAWCKKKKRSHKLSVLLTFPPMLDAIVKIEAFAHECCYDFDELSFRKKPNGYFQFLKVNVNVTFALTLLVAFSSLHSPNNRFFSLTCRSQILQSYILL